jgi:hypothetical protein
MKYFDDNKVKSFVYKDAVKLKFNNKSITVVERDSTIYIDIRRLTNNNTIPTYSKINKNKIQKTVIPLSKEAAEILLIGLSKQLGYSIYEIKK